MWWWEVTEDHAHVWPDKDVVEHLVAGTGANDAECICGPSVTPVVREADGSVGWIYTHHSLDGRERFE